MKKEEYTFTEGWKSELILAFILFFPLMFTVTGRF